MTLKRWLGRWLIVLLSVLAIACRPAVDSPPVAPTTPIEIPAAPIDRLTTYLSEQTRIPSDDLRVERVEAVNWPDACLGLAESGEVCAQVVTPGFRVEFLAPQRRYVVHSDRTGRSIHLQP